MELPNKNLQKQPFLCGKFYFKFRGFPLFGGNPMELPAQNQHAMEPPQQNQIDMEPPQQKG